MAFAAYSVAFPSKPSADTIASPRYASPFDGSFASASRKEISRLGIVEALVQQHAPAHFVDSLAVRRLRRQTKLLVRLLPLFQTPEALSPSVRITTARQPVETCLRLSAMPMLAQRPAVRRHSSRCNGASSAHRQERKRGSETVSFVQSLLHLRQFQQRRRQLRFIVRRIHRRLLILQRVDLLFQFLLLRQQCALRWIVRRLLARAQDAAV